jgi:UDP-hydrolysing UDP-N-acetyl-D-glucosamine 2-epimerase
VSGALSLDNLADMAWLSSEQLEKQLGLDLAPPPLLVTYHPVTLEADDTEWQVQELLAALDEVACPVVFTYPNADTQGRSIIRLVDAYVASHKDARVAVSLGTQAYFSLLRHCAALVGNSSSGIIEAASFRLPVVNIGNRQRGRVHVGNVLDVGYDRSAVAAGICRVLEPDFRAGLADLVTPYGDGRAAERVVAGVKRVAIDETLLLKRSTLTETAGRAGAGFP